MCMFLIFVPLEVQGKSVKPVENLALEQTDIKAFNS